MKKTETVKDERTLAVMTTTLVALLLISQLSLASERSDSRFFLDSDYYSVLESDEPESNNTKVITPDFLHVNSVQKQNNISSWSEYGLTLVYVKNHTNSCSIRSPPFSA